MEISINGRLIGAGHPPYIICELSGNHNGSLERMLHMIEVAASTGCDAIKIQSYTPDTLTIDCNKPDFRIQGGLWDGHTLYSLYKKAYTPFEWHAEIFNKARNLGVTIFSTPFDEESADLLEELGAPAYKVASFEANDLALISHIAKKKKPMIISTGLANLAEIEQAVTTARDNGCTNIALLHCISSYPAPTAEANLATIAHLSSTFGVVSGLSDHTLGTATSVAAVALGASIVEKHFTIARDDGGPDADFSLEPSEFTQLCKDSFYAWQSIGRVNYVRTASETKNLLFRRSLYAVKDIKKGEVITKENVRSIRPGFGLPPSSLPKLLGRRVTCDVERGIAFDWKFVE